jgi:NAD-dependent deacetylase
MTAESVEHELAEAIDAVGGGLLLVVTGAGVSAASGIATFRGTDENAIWKRDPIEMATRAYFEQDPVGQWTWYFARLESLFRARPNDAHYCLAMLERWQFARGGEFLLVTQNIDTLHEQAGSKALIKVHGTADRVRCTRYGCRLAAPSGSMPGDEAQIERFRRAPSRESLPRCPECGALLRAHVLFFDEYYHEHIDYGFADVERAAERMGLLLFVGTSLSVGATELVLCEATRRAVPAWSIDPDAVARAKLRPVAEPAERLLPAVCERLGIGGE